MKKEKNKAPKLTTEDQFLEEVHKTELEIDRFLAQGTLQAEEILVKATQQVEKLQAETAKEASGVADKHMETLLDEARERAKQIVDDAAQQVAGEAKKLEREKEDVIRTILAMVLGRDQ